MIRVLIVEDEAIVAAEIEMHVRRLGYEAVGTANNGRSAIALARESMPDVVLMDIRLQGGMDGIETARRIQAERPAPVVFVTAFSAVPGNELPEGARRVSKPFTASELRAAITGALT